MAEKVAIIAGAGQFPLHIARAAKQQGVPVVAVGIQGWADPSLAAHVDAYEEVSMGQLGRLIERLRAHGVRQAVMAGKVTKAVLLDPRMAVDAETRAILEQAKDVSVEALLGSVAARLAQAGITVLDSSTFLAANLCPRGVLTRRAPSPEEAQDIQIGQRMARLMAELDVGQTVVVKRRVIVAVEALEGTDAAIRRAQTLAGAGLVVVKAASPRQDRRFDLPVVGPETVTTLTAAGASCLAMEAGFTLLLDRDALISAADAANLCLVGVT